MRAECRTADVSRRQLSERRTPCVKAVTCVVQKRAVGSRLCVDLVAAKKLSPSVSKVSVVWLLGSECVVCGTPARGVCQACSDALVAPVVPPLLAIDSATVLCSYEGVGAELVQAVKFGNHRQAIAPMLNALAPSLPSDVEAVVAVPTDPERVRSRGYDLTAALAQGISARIGAPTMEPLVRVSSGAQVGLGRAERQQVEYQAHRAVPERILLVDDVVTTGATAVACAIALGLAGARQTSFVALAATPAEKVSRVKAG